MANPPAQGYEVVPRSGRAPIPLKCPVCGHDRFYTRRTLMNTAGMSFFNLDWLNRDALNYVCEDCGHVSWFMERA